MDTLERGTYYKSPARFQRMEAAQREEAALKALFERKHFAEILGLMYREKTIRQKDADLKGKMASEGTTPRRLTDLIGSLCDLTSGSGDKGTPIVYIQGYFDNYTAD